MGMANILDYLSARGNYKISHSAPFNDVDALILSRFSYLPFAKINLKKRETIKSIAEKMASLDTKDFAWKNDQKLIHLLGISTRFSKLKVTDLIAKNDAEISEQFLGITIHLPNLKLFISFVGTDSSLYGWREDFNLALLEEIPSQAEGARYLKRIAWKYFLKRIYIGGHSKGGNIAMYSAVSVPDFYQHRIIAVFNLDGPGLPKRLAEKDHGWLVLPRIKSFIPQDSIIGRLFTHTEKFEVVKSNARNFWQHDLYSWEIDLDKNRPVPSTATRKSEFLDQSITRWLKSATPEQKEIFVDLLFRILKDSKVGTPVDLAAAGIRAFPAMLKSYRTLSKSERTVMMEVIKKLVGAMYQVGRHGK